MDNLNINKELAFYKTQLNELAAGAIRNDYHLAQTNNEIRQMRAGLTLIASLNNFQPKDNFNEIFDHFTEQVNVHLQNDLTGVLVKKNHSKNVFVATFIKSANSQSLNPAELEFHILPSMLSSSECLLVNSLTVEDIFIEEVRKKLLIRYFIMVPLIIEQEIIAYLITGRKTETLLFAASRFQLYDVYTLQAIAGVLSALKKQFNQFEALENERQRISAEMHDELGSKITHIALLSELLSSKIFDDGVLKSHLKNIGISSRELVDSMSEIIWEMNPHNDTLENLMAHLREQVVKFFEPSGILLLIEFPDDVLLIKLTNIVRRNLYLVTIESLNNVVKHAEATEVSLNISCIYGLVNFMIKDNGKGFSDKIHHNSNGLINMRKRLESINGNINWVSNEQGTTVYYSFAY